jgi:hypothetical protein
MNALRTATLAAAALAASGCAQSIDGKTKIGLETPLIVFERVKMKDVPAGNELTSTELTVGIAPPARASYLAAWPAPIGVEVAHALSDSFVLGARVGFGYSTFHGEDGLALSGGTWDVVSASLTPHAEYVFDGDRVRPFAGVEAGVALASSSGEDDASGTTTLFTGGGVLGLHAFLGDSLSIDPRLSIAYGVGSYEQEQTATLDLGGVEQEVRIEADRDIARLNVVLRVGLSGWF